MSYCPGCGREVPEGSFFCKECGGPQAQGRPSGITNEDLALFVGKNREKYLPRFAKFTRAGADSFRLTWHWPAFFVPFLWMLYRKLYGWAALALIIWLTPYAGLLTHLLWGIVANRIYYNHAKKKILEIRELHPAPETQEELIVSAGGVGNVFLIIVAVIVLSVLIGVLTVFFIPAYRARPGLWGHSVLI